MRFVIVTGVSGAGKTAALKMLEDMGYFCVDNLPIQLLEKFASLLPEMQSENVRNVALGIDARSGSALDELEVVLDRMKQTGYDYEILFMDAEDSVLVKRYKESRRSHPLARAGRVDEGIRLEREKTKFLRKRADYIIDTSHLLTRELRQEIEKIFVDDREFSNIMISVLSFGFKYGIPADADLVFDVRFLPNPYYVDELRPLTGLDDEVFNYVMASDTAKAFADKLEDMIRFLIPNYIKEGKTSLVIGIGCTGGKHRSVTIARELFSRISKSDEYGIRLEHRDAEKDRLLKNNCRDEKGGRETVKEGSGCHFQEKSKKNLQDSLVWPGTVRWQNWRHCSAAAAVWKKCRMETENYGSRQKMKQLQEKALHYCEKPLI